MGAVIGAFQLQPLLEVGEMVLRLLPLVLFQLPFALFFWLMVGFVIFQYRRAAETERTAGRRREGGDRGGREAERGGPDHYLAAIELAAQNLIEQLAEVASVALPSGDRGAHLPDSLLASVIARRVAVVSPSKPLTATRCITGTVGV